MASKITRRQYAKADHDLNFIRTYQAQAMAVDRTEGTHPIAMPPDQLDHTTMLNDPIVYNKSAVMMRMLEDIMGANNMQNGIRTFLRNYYLKEASWDDLLDVLDKEAPTAGVRQFSEVWVHQKGMPVIHTTYKDGQLIISQTDPFGRGLCWRQKFDVFVIFNLGSSRTIHVDMQQPVMTFKLREKPSFIIPNYDGRGYGQFTLDDNYVTQLPLRLITTRNDLNRLLLLETIYNHYLMGKVNPSYFGEIYRLMMKEKNPLIMSTAIDHMFKIVDDVKEDQRAALELCVMDLLTENKTKECHQFVIRKMTNYASSPEVLDQLERIWTRHNDPLLNEHDYMEMAYRLAIMHPKQWQEFLQTQRSRLQTEERRKDFDYVSRACNPNPDERTALFNKLLRPENRQQEPWAIHTLRLLNSDVFEPQSNSYIEPSLKSLEYLQQTSDIFFPSKWMNALMAGHKSKEAIRIIEQFLTANPNYPDNLKNKVLSASWILMKQVPYVPRVNTPAKKATPAKATATKATKKKTTKKK
jgi:aminopeptidase N